jgi:uncharacterized membrane protein YphA (DoxX/SURF4 family)
MPATKKIASWVLRILAALIMLQTLYYKFSGVEESVFIFSTLGIEPWGRILTGCIELVAAVLLIIPSTIIPGALLTIGIMAGAIASHLLKLGIVVQNDSGLLFVYACTVMLCAILLLFLHKQEFIKLKQQFKF